MKRTRLTLTTALLIVCFAVTHSSSVRAAELTIHHDYDSALALSVESGKPVLIDFYFDT